jgi:hypothetical protein
MIGTILICTVLSVHDGDQVKCRTGETVRIAAADAGELDGTCHTVCPAMSARASRDYLVKAIGGRVDEARSIRYALPYSREKLVLRNAPVVRFHIVGRSGKRLVGENFALRCDLQRTGAVVEWPRYIRQYRLKRCG